MSIATRLQFPVTPQVAVRTLELADAVPVPEMADPLHDRLRKSLYRLNAATLFYLCDDLPSATGAAREGIKYATRFIDDAQWWLAHDADGALALRWKRSSTWVQWLQHLLVWGGATGDWASIATICTHFDFTYERDSPVQEVEYAALLALCGFFGLRSGVFRQGCDQCRGCQGDGRVLASLLEQIGRREYNSAELLRYVQQLRAQALRKRKVFEKVSVFGTVYYHMMADAGVTLQCPDGDPCWDCIVRIDPRGVTPSVSPS